MGLFSSIFSLSGAKELTRISDGLANVTNLLDRYEDDDDLSLLYISAWICRISIIEVVEKNNFPMTYSLFAPIRGRQQKLSLNEVYLMSITRLLKKADDRSYRAKTYVKDILCKRPAFYKIDNQISQEQKKLFC